MKMLKTLCVASMLALGVASTASAYSFNPTSGSAVFSGPTNLVKGGASLACTSTFTVVPNLVGTLAPTANVTTATFAGGLFGICKTVTKVGTWVATPTSFTNVNIAGVAVNTPIGNCTPPAAPISTTFAPGPAATLNFAAQALDPDCVVNGTLTQTSGPAVTIVNP